MHALVISFDRLPVQFLSCYGNSWIETPHFDRLAARAVIFDQHFVRRVDSRISREQSSKWTESLAAAGIPATLFREQGAELTESPGLNPSNVHECGGENGLDAQPKLTSIAATMDAALRWLESRALGPHPSLTWVQSRGVPTPWLAPRDYATLYLDLVDEESHEPNASHSTDEDFAEQDELDLDDLEIDEEEELPAEPDEDLKLIDFSREEFDRFLREHSAFPADEPARRALSAADRRIVRSLYGGYVTLLDRELGRLLDAIEKLPDDQPVLVIVTAARGEQLDDVTALRGPASFLCDDVVHTPLLIWEWVRGAKDTGSRRQCLVQTTDLEATLADWFGIVTSGGEGQSLVPVVRHKKINLRDELFIDAPDASAIRTHEYYLVTAGTGGQQLGESAAHLFSKPEDIWDVNDVAGQSPELVESLLERLKLRHEDATIAPN